MREYWSMTKGSRWEGLMEWMVLKWKNTKCSEGEEETDDIKDEDKIYINGCKKIREQLPQCELKTIFQI